MSSGTFTTAALSTGTYTFECNIHLFTGTITVSP
jgi:plastocyanin